MFACPVARLQFTILPLEVVPAGDMIQQNQQNLSKICQMFFGIAYNILIEMYNTNDKTADRTFRLVMQICHEENVTCNKKVSFQMH